MRDIRLETLPFEFDGKTWQLCCNMNVLADVQEAYSGSIGEALSGANPMRSVLIFLAAMMNNYAEDMGWPERYEARQLGRELQQWQVPMVSIMKMVTRSIVPPEKRNSVINGEDSENAEYSEQEAVSTPDTGEENPDLSGN